MSQAQLDGRASDQYAQQVKIELATAPDAATLVSNMATWDEHPSRQNQRIISGLKQCIQTLGVNEAQAQIIKDAIESLGARFELDLPNG